MPKCNSNVTYIISALVLTYFCLKKGRTTFYQLETIVASFLHLMVLCFQSDFQPYFKMPVCGASFSYFKSDTFKFQGILQYLFKLKDAQADKTSSKQFSHLFRSVKNIFNIWIMIPLEISNPGILEFFRFNPGIKEIRIFNYHKIYFKK